MSPCSTVTPVASSSSIVMAWPGSSQSTPRSRGMSSSTPRPTMPELATSIELRPAPTLVTSDAGAPLYIRPSTKTWQSASMWLTLLPWNATPTKSPDQSKPFSLAATSAAWIMWCSAGVGLSTAGAVASGRPQGIVTPSRTSVAASATRSGVRRLSAPRSSPSPQRPHRFVASNSSALTRGSTDACSPHADRTHRRSPARQHAFEEEGDGGVDVASLLFRGAEDAEVGEEGRAARDHGDEQVARGFEVLGGHVAELGVGGEHLGDGADAVEVGLH